MHAIGFLTKTKCMTLPTKFNIFGRQGHGGNPSSSTLNVPFEDSQGRGGERIAEQQEDNTTV